MRLSEMANATGKGWGDNPADPYSFIRNVTVAAPNQK